MTDDSLFSCMSLFTRNDINKSMTEARREIDYLLASIYNSSDWSQEVYQKEKDELLRSVKRYLGLWHFRNEWNKLHLKNSGDFKSSHNLQKGDE